MSRRTRLPSLGPRGEGWFLIQLVLLAVVGATGLFGSRWSEPLQVPAAIVALLLGAAGLWLTLHGVGSLGASLTPMPKPHARSELKSDGAYALVRHPIYGGLILVSCGWAFALSPWALLPAALVALLFSLKAVVEERFLHARFGGYAAYAARVRRRFIPFLW